MEMNYCRRCSTKLTLLKGHEYTCENGHSIWSMATPAAGLWIINDKREILVTTRANEPGKGKLHFPGGFNDGPETNEATVIREATEELGLLPKDYTTPIYLLSVVDTNESAEEIVKVLVAVYYARLIGNPEIKASDDAAEARFMPLDSVDPDMIYLDAPRAGFLLLRDSGIV